MAALLAGVGIFSALLLFGVVVVRWLRLPQDLPEGLRFEPPPPPLDTVADRTQAVALAARRRVLGDQLHQAYTVVRHAMACQEALLALEAHPAAQDPAQAATVAQLRQAVGLAVGLGNEAERIADRLRNQPDDPTPGAALPDLAQRAAAARDSVEGLLKQLPGENGNRRLFMLLILLAVMVAWIAIMRWML
jgi:hypothetical protein